MLYNTMEGLTCICMRGTTSHGEKQERTLNAPGLRTGTRVTKMWR